MKNDIYEILKQKILSEYTSSAGTPTYQAMKPPLIYETIPKEFPEFEWFPGDESIDEDIVETLDYADIERLLRNPEMTTQEAFELVYRLLIDEDEDIPDEIAKKLIAIVLARFFEDLHIDHLTHIDRPFQLFFIIKKYFFTTYEVERLALAILMIYIAKHKKLNNIYYASVSNTTLNNQKSINVLLSMLRYLTVSDMLDIVDRDDKFIEYYISTLKQLANNDMFLKALGFDPEDFRMLLPYLIEDDNTVRSLFRLIINNGMDEFCKYDCLALLLGKTNVKKEKNNDND